MVLQLQDRIVIVTGGAAGIGGATPSTWPVRPWWPTAAPTSCT